MESARFRLNMAEQLKSIFHIVPENVRHALFDCRRADTITPPKRTLVLGSCVPYH